MATRTRFAIEVVDVDPSRGFEYDQAYVVIDRWDDSEASLRFDTMEEVEADLSQCIENAEFTEFWDCTCEGEHGDCGYWERDHP